MSSHQCHWTEVENIFLPREATIVHTLQATPTETHFTLAMDDGRAMEFEPGQIVELSLFGYGEIPIGFASSPTRTDTFDLVVRSVGRVSNAVTRLGKGDVGLRPRPAGQGLRPRQAARPRRAHRRGRHRHLPDAQPDPVHPGPARRVLALRALLRLARALPAALLATTSPAGAAARASSTTRPSTRPTDGWTGNVGVITTLFPKVELSPETRAVICGPPIFYRFVIRELDMIGIPREHVFVDLERRMKCGVGKCGHCQINDKYVCVDGPVFPFAEVQGLEEAF